MGVKLTGLLNKKEIEFSVLKNKKIAIDFSNMAYQFLSSIRQPDGTPLMDSKGNITSVYVGIFSRITNLMSQGIKPCFVFDGKPPLLKIKTQEAREHRKRVAEKKFEEAREEENIELMGRYAKQTSRLSRDIVEGSKELLKVMGLPIISAPSEADAQMALMNEKNDVDFVATSDADVLLYGALKVITNLTLSQRRRLPSGGYVKTSPELIELKNILKDLGINRDQLIVIAILVGTDYNEGVKRIGPKTALKLVKQYKDFDELFKEVKAEFNWKEVYAVFKSMPVMKEYQLRWKGVDAEGIKKFLVDEHEFSEERVDKTLSRIIKTKDRSQKGLGSWVK